MSKENTALAIVNGNADEFSVKKALYNLANSANTKLSSMVNKTFKIKLVTFTVADVLNRNSGEVEQKDRALVIDEAGTTYHTVAGGLVSSLKSLCTLFGADKNGLFEFTDDIECTVKERQTPNGHTYYIEIV